jgi:hypothetical protein
VRPKGFLQERCPALGAIGPKGAGATPDGIDRFIVAAGLAVNFLAGRTS